MKTLDLSKNLIGLDWNDLKEPMSKFVANVLVAETQWDAIKLYDLSMRIYKDWKIEIDDSDLKLIEDKLNESKGLTILAKWQILKQIEECKLQK